MLVLDQHNICVQLKLGKKVMNTCLIMYNIYVIECALSTQRSIKMPQCVCQ